MRLAGKVAVVTGGGSGIGRGIVLAMAKEGADIAIPDIQVLNAQKVSEEVKALGRKVLAMKTDVTSSADVKTMVDRTREALGRIDILVNNAGITGGNAPTWELDPTVWRRVIEVNLVAPYLTSRAVVPHMVQSGYGRIVNIASIAGKEGNPNASHYSASKAGLIALTKSLAKELATKGVLVNAVSPAAARTAIFDTMTQTHIDYMLAKIPMARFLEVGEAAAMIAWLASEECSFSTGAVFDLSGGRATY
jgi:2-dehydro-3-deoxy-L-rhamnonate dehydrogenase (NAD+)